MRTTTLPLLAALLLAAAGCPTSQMECEESCQRRYEDCLEGSSGPIACDVALDDCLDRCYATASARPDGG